MKKTSLTLAVATVLFTFIGTDVALAGRITNRQIQQQKRIHQGIKSGELTRGEACRIEKEQHEIRKHKKMAWRDGKLTPKERVRLENEQDRASGLIYRLNHNDIER